MDNFVRIDIILKERFKLSRERAKEAVINGYVSCDGKVFKKPSEKIPFDKDVYVDEKAFLKYVGRGGIKLEKAFGKFGIDVSGMTCVDVGASTGGFTDCMLQHGAKRIFAVDVGTGQLAEAIKNNPRVVSMENTNIVNLTKYDFHETIDFASIDVSFVSITKILLYVWDIIKDKAEVVALIKPQFEAGRANISKKGIVKNPKTHISVIKTVYSYAEKIGFTVKNLTFSPVKGVKGNIEYIIYLSKGTEDFNLLNAADIIEKTVYDAFKTFSDIKK